MVVWHGGAVVLVVGLGKGGHARVQRLWFNLGIGKSYICLFVDTVVEKKEPHLPTSLAMPSKAAMVSGTSVTRHLGHGTRSADCCGSRYRRLGHRVAT